MSLAYLLFRRVLGVAALRLRSRDFKELKIVVLRHDLAVLRRQIARPRLEDADRVFLAAASRLLRGTGQQSFFVRPGTPLGGTAGLFGDAGRTRGASSSTTDPGFLINSRTNYSEATGAQSGLASSTLTIQSETLTNNATCGAAGSGGRLRFQLRFDSQTARFRAHWDGTVMEQSGRNRRQTSGCPQGRKWLDLAAIRCHWLPPVAVWIAW
jgi:hypothetical protein